MILAVLTAFLSFYHNTKHTFHNAPRKSIFKAADGPFAHIVPAAALEKRQCLARYFTSLASAAFFAKRKRAAKGIICAKEPSAALKIDFRDNTLSKLTILQTGSIIFLLHL